MIEKQANSPTWIMGGGKGIGSKIAEILSYQNSPVLVSSRSGISGRSLKNKSQITDCIGDLEDYNAVSQHIKEFKENGNDIEVIYYCVHKPFTPCKLDEMTWGSLEEQFVGCLKPFYNLIYAISEGKLNKLKSVLVLTSNTINIGTDMFAHRNIAKGALESYIDVISKTDTFKEISFNGVALGYVDTPQFEEYIKHLKSIKSVNNSNFPEHVSSLSEIANYCISIGHGKLRGNSGKIFQLNESQ